MGGRNMQNTGGLGGSIPHRCPVVLIKSINVSATPYEEPGHINHALARRRVQWGPAKINKINKYRQPNA